MKKYLYEEVKECFINGGCVLLSKEYINSGSKLDYICSCGNTSKISFQKFLKGQRCKECAYKNRNNRKHSFEYVKTFFETNKCILLSTEYINCMELLDYICSCGNQSKISFNAFQKGERCKKCGSQKSKQNNPNTYNYEYVYNYFEQNDCMLLSKNYKSNNSKLKYICSCGNTSYITFNHFLNGHRCKKCGFIKSSDKRRLSYNYVKNYFTKCGCILLSDEYVDNSTKLKYICLCGNKSEITFSNFQQGSRCKKCIQSKGERKLNSVFKNKSIFNIPQKTFEGLIGLKSGLLSYDFYLPHYNLLIEYQGIQHEKYIKGFHKSKKDFETQQEHDKRKREYAMTNNIKLLEIWYYDFDNIEEILLKSLM